MATLWLRFRYRLWRTPELLDPDVLLRGPAFGVVFHRWLPRGAEDAIQLDTGRPEADLRVWLETKQTSMKFVEERPVVFADELLGEMVLRDVSDDDCDRLRAGAQLPVYERPPEVWCRAVGKRVVKLLYPPVASFLDILRTTYGQHWLPMLPRWDSREMSLGYYCYFVIRLWWRLNPDEPWLPFLPEPPFSEPRAARYHPPHPLLRQFMSEAAWRELADLVARNYRPSLAARLLAEANQHLDRGDLRFAALLGVTALEVAIDQYIQRMWIPTEAAAQAVGRVLSHPDFPTLEERLAAMRGILEASRDGRRVADLKLTRQLEVIRAARILPVSGQVFDHALGAIALRNSVAHEGRDVPPQAREKIRALLEVGAALLDSEPLRFPSRPYRRVASKCGTMETSGADHGEAGPRERHGAPRQPVA